MRDHAPLPPPPHVGIPPLRRLRRRWLVAAVIGGSLVALTLVSAGVFVVVQLGARVAPTGLADPQVDAVGGGGFDELLDGDPGSPIAVDPLACGVCFDLDDARTVTLPQSSYDRLGLIDRDGGTGQGAARAAQLEATKWWEFYGGTPESCFFTSADFPLFFTPGLPEDAEAAQQLLYYPYLYHDASEAS